jgi:hypothetical protein
MPTAHFSKPLGPDELRIAADAYEAALSDASEYLHPLPPHRARRIVAAFVIREALRGQRDPGRLRDRAVAFVKRVAKSLHEFGHPRRAGGNTYACKRHVRRSVMASFQVTFSRMLMGVPFPIASFQIRHARDAGRAARAAELKLFRRTGLMAWHERADTVHVAPGDDDKSCA